MLVTLREVLEDAKRGRYCVGAFNVYNFETVDSVLKGAEDLNSPVIIAFGERYAGHISIELISTMVIKMAERHPIPIVLHLDHAHSLESIETAIRNGFTSVMYDGSKLEFSDNLMKTREVVELSHPRNVSVEAELGYVARAGEVEAGETEIRYHLTDPRQAAFFVSESGVDALAVSIGNVHGLRAYKGSVKLDLDLLNRIKNSCDIPLVLHGGSGVSNQELNLAVAEGICKLNINTELSTSAADEIEKFLRVGEGAARLEHLMVKASGAMRRVVKSYLTMLGSEGKARKFDGSIF